MVVYKEHGIQRLGPALIRKGKALPTLTILTLMFKHVKKIESGYVVYLPEGVEAFA